MRKHYFKLHPILQLLIATVAALATIAFLSNCSTMPDPRVQAPAPVSHELKVTVDSSLCPKVETDKDERLNSEGSATLSPLAYVAGDKLHFNVVSGITVADVLRFNDDIIKVEAWTKIRDLELFVNSPGGDAFSGLAMADLLEETAKRGWKITGYANGIVASAAVPIFSVCTYRVASKGTIFMVHEAALWKWPGRESASDIRSQNELMITLQNKYLSYLVRHSKLDLKQWTIKEKATTWFSAEEAKAWGIVDEIR